MQMLRNLRLAARLGVAFGALALGLLGVVSVVAFSATDGLNDARSISLADDVPRYTVDRGRHRDPPPRGGRTCSRSTSTCTTATSPRRTRWLGGVRQWVAAGADDAAFGDMIGTLEATRPTPRRGRGRRRQAAARRRTSRCSAVARKALEASRKETVDRRRGARRRRARSTRTRSSSCSTQIGAAVGASSKGTLDLRRRRGREGLTTRSPPTKRAILIAALLSVLVALALADLHHALGHAPGARSSSRRLRVARRQLTSRPSPRAWRPAPTVT